MLDAQPHVAGHAAAAPVRSGCQPHRRLRRLAAPIRLPTGYARHDASISRRVDDWVRSAGFGADDMPAGLDRLCGGAQGAAALAALPRPQRKSLEAARLFLRFLREQGVLPPAAVAPSPVERWPLLGEFRAWARQHCGLAEMSIDAYQPILAELLAAVDDDLRAYTAETLCGFVLERVRRHRITRAKTVVVATRVPTFSGRHGAVHARDGARNSRLHFLAAIVGAAVPRRGRCGARDRLLPHEWQRAAGPGGASAPFRLGLRASEVAGLKIADIDWRNGRLSELVALPLTQVCLQGAPSVRVHGKGRKERCLPLWKETTADLRGWLAVRGQVRCPELFANAEGTAMTRAGFEYVLDKHVRAAERPAPRWPGAR